MYDDTQVKETTEDQIVTRAAYLLFYQRRSVHNSVVQNHNWIFNFVKNFNYKQPKYKPHTRLNQSHDALLDTNYGICTMISLSFYLSTLVLRQSMFLYSINKKFLQNILRPSFSLNIMICKH